MSEVTPEILAEAKADGWVEIDQWRGPKEAWVNADEFVRRKYTVLPLLRTENQKLHDGLQKTQAELAALRGNMDEFIKYQQEQTQARLAEQRKQLLAQKREADEAGDDARVVAIEEQLDENAEARAAARKAPEKAPETPAALPPHVKAWQEANPWFGQDDVKTGLAMGLAREAAKKGLTGQAYFDHIDSGLAKVYAAPPAHGKTEGGGPSGQGDSNRPSGKYASLPADAKAQCDADAKRFVGPNKMFKTEADWQKHFCSLYFQE